MENSVAPWFQLHYEEWVKREGLELIEGYRVTL